MSHLKKAEPSRAKVKVKLGAVKIHGPNSPIGLEGTREHVEGSEIAAELTYAEIEAGWGKEAADAVFAGIDPEEAQDG
jgi:hypothetical protein